MLDPISMPHQDLYLGRSRGMSCTEADREYGEPARQDDRPQTSPARDGSQLFATRYGQPEIDEHSIGLCQNLLFGGCGLIPQPAPDLGGGTLGTAEPEPAHEESACLVAAYGDPHESVGTERPHHGVRSGIRGRRRDAWPAAGCILEEGAHSRAVGRPGAEAIVDGEGAAKLQLGQLDLSALHEAGGQGELRLGEKSRREQAARTSQEQVPVGAPGIGGVAKSHLEIESPCPLLEPADFFLLDSSLVGGSEEDHARAACPKPRSDGLLDRRILGPRKDQEQDGRPLGLGRGRVTGGRQGEDGGKAADEPAPTPGKRERVVEMASRSFERGERHGFRSAPYSRAGVSFCTGERQIRTSSRRLPLAHAALLLAVLAGGCFTDVSVFTSGRTEDLCNGAIPLCRQYAGCELDSSSYVRGRFPGELRVAAHAEIPRSKLVARVLFTEMSWPGTELLALAYSPGCGEVRGEHLVDVDFFDLAGSDRILTFEIPLETSGGHLFELFSDMAASFLLTVDVEGR
jgi:hypothetical protein